MNVTRARRSTRKARHPVHIISSIEDLAVLKIPAPKRRAIQPALESLGEFAPSWTDSRELLERLRACTQWTNAAELAAMLGVNLRWLRRLRHHEVQPSLAVVLRWATIAHKLGGPDFRLRIRVAGCLEVDPVLDFERRFREAVLADIVARAGDPDPDPEHAARSDYDAIREMTRSGVTWAEAMARFGRFLLERALAEAGGNPASAARRLGLSRSRVYQLILDFGTPADGETEPRLRLQPRRAIVRR